MPSLDTIEPERWARLKQVFQSARQEPAGRRDAFLDRACAGDAELRHMVEGLLASHDAAGTFISRPAVNQIAAELVTARTGPEAMDPTGVTATANTLTEGTDEAHGAELHRIGPYRVLSELGRGGMGNVYLAVRADQEYEKQVAIKLIRRGMDSEEIVSRFRRERQILASLEHPHIARLFDGGTTEDGLPYFVMEKIQGQPIDQYCTSRKLTIDERLGLFRKVASAVQYAHQNLVVHRDIKPSNVVVTDDGVPKLLDFGIAKLLNPELSAEAGPPTAAGLRVMTPQYASPEQVRGETVTTATDVYSLGVLLYELLTGQRPYRIASRQITDVVKAVCEQEPEPPSTAARRRGTGTDAGASSREPTSQRLVRRLRGDLDTIVLKALRKEPPRRYPSVDALSEDIHRHLEGLPVTARKDTLGYRVGKFVGRHKVGVSVAACLALLLAGFAVTMALQRAQIASERDRAERQLERSERVTDFMIGMFDAATPEQGRGRELTAREVLEKSSERIKTELNADPQVRAAVMDAIGASLLSLSGRARAQSGFKLQREALELRRRTLPADHPDLAESLMHVGRALVEDPIDAPDLEAGENLLRQALDIWRARPPDDPRLGQTLRNLAVVVGKQGRFEEAEPIYREALALARQYRGANSSEAGHVMNGLAWLIERRGRVAEAEGLYIEALGILRQAVGSDHVYVTNVLWNLTRLALARGDAQAAERYARENVEIRRKLYPDNPLMLALPLGYLGQALVARGAFDEGLQALAESVAAARRAAGHPSRLSTALSWLGAAYMKQGDLVRAERALRESAEVPGLDALNKLSRGADLAECLVKQRRFPEAERLLLTAYEQFRAKWGEQDEDARYTLQRLVTQYEAWGKPDKASQYRNLLAAKAPATAPTTK